MKSVIRIGLVLLCLGDCGYSVCFNDRAKQETPQGTIII